MCKFLPTLFAWALAALPVAMPAEAPSLPGHAEPGAPAADAVHQRVAKRAVTVASQAELAAHYDLLV